MWNMWMHRVDTNASVHGANESMNNKVNDKEQRTAEREAVESADHAAHGEASLLLKARLYFSSF